MSEVQPAAADLTTNPENSEGINIQDNAEAGNGEGGDSVTNTGTIGADNQQSEVHNQTTQSKDAHHANDGTNNQSTNEGELIDVTQPTTDLNGENLRKEDKQIQQTITNELMETMDNEQQHSENKSKDGVESSKEKSSISVGTSPKLSTTTVETQEVSSTRNDEPPRSARSSSRRPSYNSSRSYSGGSYQNYGLTYLPYKSNFEPSEDARRRADEFFKTLKL